MKRKTKNILKGLAVAAFTCASLGGLTYTSLLKNDVKIDKSDISAAPVNFHGIPAEDVMIAIYASYFSGVSQDGEFALAMRAENTFGMNNALIENFTGDDAPWVMLDSLSDGRNDSRIGENMHGSHFITAYHKETEQVIITAPGMEYDDGPMDTLDDARQLLSGSAEQTLAMAAYVTEIETMMRNSEFTDSNGNPLQFLSEKPIIASHSLGGKPTHLMAMAGYQTIMMDARPMTNGYIDSLMDLHEITFGETIDKISTLETLDANSIDIRAAHANIWNSPLLPWTDVHVVPNSFVYGTGEVATLADRHVGGDHAAEVFVPSIMHAVDPLSSASQAPKGREGMIIVRR